FMLMLLRRHYQVLFASTGDEMRAQLRAHPDNTGIVIMDLSLKDHEDGLTLTRYLRSRPRWASLPVIALTAHAFSDDRSNALEAGCSRIMTKPFDVDELRATMAELLASSRHTEQPSLVA